MRQSVLLTLSFSAILSGCAYRPIAVDQEQLFVGVFKSQQSEESNCEYSAISGIGLKLGFSVVGVGYFDRQTFKITDQKFAHCISPLGEVFVGSAAIEAVTSQNLNKLISTQ